MKIIIITIVTCQAGPSHLFSPLFVYSRPPPLCSPQVARASSGFTCEDMVRLPIGSSRLGAVQSGGRADYKKDQPEKLSFSLCCFRACLLLCVALFKRAYVL